MAIYMVGYELNRPGQYDPDLINALKAYGTRWHRLDSTWIIETSQTPVQVRDTLQQYLNENDELLVAAIGAPAAWYGFNNEESEWLKNHLK